MQTSDEMKISGQIAETPCWTSWFAAHLFGGKPAAENQNGIPPSLVSALHRDDLSPDQDAVSRAKWPQQCR